MQVKTALQPHLSQDPAKTGHRECSSSKLCAAAPVVAANNSPPDFKICLTLYETQPKSFAVTLRILTVLNIRPVYFRILINESNQSNNYDFNNG